MGVAATATAAWLVAAMTAWSPIDRPHYIFEAKETPEQATERYEAISWAVVNVAYNPNNAPVILAKGDHSRASTALLMVSLAFFESGFRRDIDLGQGKYSAGDFGRSHCMMQIQTGSNRRDTSTLEKLIGKSWSAEDLVQDRDKCFTAGFIIMSKSFTACHSLPLEQRLAVYASGNCDEGHEESEKRFNKAHRWYDGHKPIFPDVAVMMEQVVVASL